MKDVRRNLIVGFFVLIGLVGLGVLAVLFGQNPTWLQGSDTYPIEIQFRTAGGVRTGNIVTVNGIQVGRVVEVGLFEPGRLDAEFNVRVVAAIEKKYLIPDGSTAITSEPVLGQGRPSVQIEPGPSTNPPLGPGARISGRVLGAVESIFPSHIVTTFTSTAEQISMTGKALTPVLEDLHLILQKRSPEEADRLGAGAGNLASAVARFDELMKNLNELSGDPDTRNQLRNSIANLYQMSEDGRVVMTDLKSATASATDLMSEARKSVSTIESTMANVNTRVNDVGTRFASGFEKLDQLLSALNKVIQPISRGQGTIGKLFTDNELYEALVLTMQRLAATITDYQALAREWQKGKVKVGF